MITKCPTCGAKYKIDPSKLSSKNAKIRCKKCGTVFSVYENAIDKPATQESKPSGTSSSIPKSDMTIYVCSARDEIFETVKQRSGAKNVVKIDDGVEAIYKIIKDKPNLAFLDVDLPRIYGFEISELVRRNDPDKKIYMVLLGSIYNKNAYKREPTYTYGADKYIDHSKVDEELDNILSSISGGTVSEQPKQQPAATSEPEPQQKSAPAEKPAAEPSAAKKEIDLDSLSPEDKAWVKKAERKARIIAADIALYNEEGLKEGLANGDVYERIAADLDAGRKHFNDNIPEHIRELKDFIGEEVEKMLAKKREEYGL